MGRSLPTEFMHDLKSGILNPLLVRIQQDDTLMLGLRGMYVNVYYRGGSILRLERIGEGRYRASFDKQYDKDASRQLPSVTSKPSVTTADDASAWAGAFKELKEVMNRFFVKYPKPEREFQQLVAWENNRSALANASEYFITDIEFSSTELGARFDMVGLKWLSDDRRVGKRVRPVLFEMKYGDGAIKGGSDIKKHLDDVSKLLNSQEEREGLARMIVAQFNQLSKLGLLNYNKTPKIAEEGLATLQADSVPEVVFLLANHNPRSKGLLSVLNDEELGKSVRQASHFDLRFYVAAFAGYAMHHASMVDFEKFREMAGRLR